MRFWFHVMGSLDEWAQDIRDPGVVVQCCPREGVLSAQETIDFVVQVYADCWGLYHDQVLLKVSFSLGVARNYYSYDISTNMPTCSRNSFIKHEHINNHKPYK